MIYKYEGYIQCEPIAAKLLHYKLWQILERSKAGKLRRLRVTLHETYEVAREDSDDERIEVNANADGLS